MKLSTFKFVYESSRPKLTKYFKREITSPVYIRLYRVHKTDGVEIEYFQVSGDDEAFSSIPVRTKELEDKIIADFPFIKIIDAQY